MDEILLVMFEDRWTNEQCPMCMESGVTLTSAAACSAGAWELRAGQGKKEKLEMVASSRKDFLLCLGSYIPRNISSLW